MDRSVLWISRKEKKLFRFVFSRKTENTVIYLQSMLKLNHGVSVEITGVKFVNSRVSLALQVA